MIKKLSGNNNGGVDEYVDGNEEGNVPSGKVKQIEPNRFCHCRRLQKLNLDYVILE